MDSKKRSILRGSYSLFVCLPWVLASACSSAPPSNSSAEGQATPSDTTATTEQTIELEPGHTLSIRRMEDSSIVLTELGKIGEHAQVLEDLPAKYPLTTVVSRLAPGVELKAPLRAPVGGGMLTDAQRVGDSNAAESVGRAQEALVPDGTPKSVEQTIVAANTSSQDQDYVTLRCNEPAVTMCFPAMNKRASLDWEYSGYYRTLAVNRAARNSATFVLYKRNGTQTQQVSSVSVPAGYFAQMQYLSATRSYARAEVSIASNEKVGISSLATAVTPRAQENNNWCWLAAAQMALAVLGDGREQCKLANAHWGRTDCCQQIGNALYGTSGCDGGGESVQVFQKQGYASNEFDVINSPLRLAQLLQSGPVVVWHPAGPHYSVLSDYQEVYENGTWVPYAFHSDPWSPSDYHQANHASWVRLDQVGTGNGGFANIALGDVHSATHGGSLTAAIARASWEAEAATIYFDDPTATSFEYQFLNGGTTSGYGELWAQGTVAATRSWNVNTWHTSIGMGPWVWYYARVRACAGGQCGAWTDKHSVSYPPIVTLDSVTWANNVVTATVHADPAPDETFFRYRVIDAGNSHLSPWKAGRAAGTAARFSSSATIVFGNQNVGIGPNLWLKFQVQACSQIGCSAWAEKTIHTG